MRAALALRSGQEHHDGAKNWSIKAGYYFRAAGTKPAGKFVRRFVVLKSFLKCHKNSKSAFFPRQLVGAVLKSTFAPLLD